VGPVGGGTGEGGDWASTRTLAGETKMDRKSAKRFDKQSLACFLFLLCFLGLSRACLSAEAPSCSRSMTAGVATVARGILRMMRFGFTLFFC
jgi:hypothetical protein